MNTHQILEALEHYTGKFPRAAMKAAVEQREAITPELLRIMEDVAAHGEEYAERHGYMLHTFATFLLAQFREERAFQPLVKIVSLPGELPFDLYGDTITESLSNLLGSVYNGEQALLHGLVENEAINEYVRNAALDTFIVLEHSGQMPRDEVVSYYHDLFHGGLPRIDSYVWTGLVSSCADLPAPELLREVRQAFAEHLPDLLFSDLASVERQLMIDEERIREKKQNRFSVITDAIEEMHWWASFDPEPTSRGNRSEKTGVASVAEHRRPTPSGGAKRLIPKVGRNEPCPCGSGKKFKKCCLNKR